MLKQLVDRRVQKTRKSLQDALIELISEKSFESIKIQNILDEANIGRSTFYIHFQDKNELLDSCFDEVRKMLEEHSIVSSAGHGDFGDEDPKADVTLKLVKFIGQFPVLFKALDKQVVPVFVESYLLNHVQKQVNTRMSPNERNVIPPEIACRYWVSAFIGLLKWWIDNDIPCTAEKIDEYFKRLSEPSIMAICCLHGKPLNSLA